MDYNRFKEGQKVVCIETYKPHNHDYFLLILLGMKFPKVGLIYTLREVVDNDKGVLLKEIINPELKTNKGILEPAFCIDWFRPIDEIDELLLNTQREAESETTEITITEPETVEA